MYDKMNSLQEELNQLRPLPTSTLKSLREQLIVEWTYNSNAIEGNTLTIKETKVVLEGITIGGHSMREHCETINHKEAIEFVEDIVKNKESINEQSIKSIHQLVLKNIDTANAGVYRKENVLISGAEHIPTNHLFVLEQMGELIKSYEQFEGQSLEKSARLHVDFVKIHPFVDGNGRTARLLMNLDLMKAGLLPVIIQTTERLKYYETLDHAHVSGDYQPFIQLVVDCEIDALEKVLGIVEGR